MKKAPAPPDEAAEKVYERLMREASEYGLVVSAYGGVATLAIPAEQRKQGVRQRVLTACMYTETAEVR